ncbi:MAG: pirin family protein [Gammaproteobacteria bacterium]|nr:pirin family protein [Gammaproteobacteria bacterium]
MKKVRSIHRRGESHWVGDGFPVHSIFSYRDLGAELTPFLLLDHVGPAEFAPTGKARGVDWHPHRGFETVSIAYEGEVDHEDTAGNRGSIGAGDVQWMTAGAGVLHKELHGRDFARRGGRFELLQLWVNLPAKSKMTAPAYQTLLARDIPVVELPANGGSVRVIAGQFGSAKGPARTFTPINLLDARLRAGHRLRLNLVDGYTGALFVMKGSINVNGSESANETELVIFDRAGDEVVIDAEVDATIFVMNGQPIDEPIVGHGPFVMNTPEQIAEAFVDLHHGRLGVVTALP